MLGYISNGISRIKDNKCGGNGKEKVFCGTQEILSRGQTSSVVDRKSPFSVATDRRRPSSSVGTTEEDLLLFCGGEKRSSSVGTIEEDLLLCGTE